MSQSSMSTPPKKPSGGRSFVVVGLIAVGLVGALLVWKSTAAPPAPAVAEPPPKPAASPPPAFEPPPPPPEDIPEPPKEPEPAPALPAKPGPKRNTACDGECTGKETPELLSALGARGGQARSCYERALTTNSGLAGSITINLRVGPSGDACAASVADDKLGDALVTNCIVQRFRTGKFPKPTGGCVDVAVPIKLVPGR